MDAVVIGICCEPDDGGPEEGGADLRRTGSEAKGPKDDVSAFYVPFSSEVEPSA